MDNAAYTPLGSMSAQDVMNSPRWWEPRMEESLLDVGCCIERCNFDSFTPCEVVKVVHDDGDKEVDHDEGAEEDEGDEVDVGDVRATGLVRVKQLTRR